ncbi:MAG: [protein-PII] uridylyltransferase [Acidobacteria bacterium]|nr:[protein-PII] uridylyltransferase [Acidobacteriota bacterium]
MSLKSQPASKATSPVREIYEHQMETIRRIFEKLPDGSRMVAARSIAVDEVVQALWQSTGLGDAAALIAIGGYGRQELYPCSDVDLLVLLNDAKPTKALTDGVRMLSQQMWDCGIRLAPVTRSLLECERFDPSNVEFAIAMLDHRFLTGSQELYAALTERLLPRLLAKESTGLLAQLQEMTAERHTRYGNTLFHLEPNIKECPGGLRDAHVCAWLPQILKLAADGKGKPVPAFPIADDAEFSEAVDFLKTVRAYLHYRHDRDDNVLDWQAQDGAASARIGLSGRGKADAAYWMRNYFRHARSIERRTLQLLDEIPQKKSLAALAFGLKPGGRQAPNGFRVERGIVVIDKAEKGMDPAHEMETVLAIFEAIAAQGPRLSRNAEMRLADALPMLSASLEDGPALWRHLSAILTGPFAGQALRTMHALGILELMLPEFHGIDALVIRDAYHRYTVDEHTFLLIDTLHGLPRVVEGPLSEWAKKFGIIRDEIEHTALLYLAALLHDTGKGRSGDDHAVESSRMAQSVCSRLEFDLHETGLVLSLIQNHLEMSNALRRDIFDQETVRIFASKVQTHEQLRMLVVFTYADINAVHPDALTPWKAENLWRLYMATSNYLDRSVDEDRVDTKMERELVRRVTALQPSKAESIREFLDGFPQRYLHTRTPDEIRVHFQMAERAQDGSIQLSLQQSSADWEITLIAKDRPMLFAAMTGALTGWGMNIVTADAFSDASGIVVDSFHFTDSFRTLELNPSEREPFLESVRKVAGGEIPLAKFLAGRRRTRRRAPLVTVETAISFDDIASTHCTLLQVVAQDVPGLLHALSEALATFGCNIEVALIDTEGDTAIDVFYLTHEGGKLSQTDQVQLKETLLKAVRDNAS